MSHTPKTPTPSYTTANLPTDLPEGSVVFDSSLQKLVSFKLGSWGTLGGVGSTTYVRDNVAGVIDQIQGDIPEDWKKTDTSLKGLVIGTSCTSIGDSAFRFCSGLTGSLVIPDSVTTIGSYAFDGCSGFDGTLTLPNTIENIRRSAFDSCSGLTGPLNIPDSVTFIDDYTFNGCSSLTGSLTIPNSVTKVGVQAFADCSSLTGTLTIPNSILSAFGHSAFKNCSGLNNVDCYVEKSFLDVSSCLLGTSVTTIHVRSTDSTWTAGAGQTIGGKTGIEVIKDL